MLKKCSGVEFNALVVHVCYQCLYQNIYEVIACTARVLYALEHLAWVEHHQKAKS
jgi:hypothetical protein